VIKWEYQLAAAGALPSPPHPHVPDLVDRERAVIPPVPGNYFVVAGPPKVNPISYNFLTGTFALKKNLRTFFRK
jgi:hypothetical protein